MSHFECAIYLIGGDVVESLALVLLRERFPIELSSLKEREGAHHIGACEGEWVFDASIDMAFGCKVDDTINVLVLQESIERIEVADVHLHELVVRLILDVLEISQVARIGQLVEVDDVVFGVFVYEQAYNVTSDEASTSSYNYISFHFDFSFERELQ